MLVLVKPWPGPLPVMSPPPTLAIGPTVEHMGRHTVCIRTLLNIHVTMTHATSHPGDDAHYVYLVDRPSVHRVPAPWAADPGAEARIPHSMDGCQRPGSGSRSSYVAVLVCWHGEKALLSRGEHRRRGLHLVGGCTSDYAGSAFCHAAIKAASGSGSAERFH